MTTQEQPWEKYIRDNLLPGETYESAKKWYTDIDPDMQEFLDIERLIAISENPGNDDVFDTATRRLKEVVVKILSDENARTHRGFGNAISNLTWLKMIYPKDQEVQRLYIEYLGSGKD